MHHGDGSWFVFCTFANLFFQMTRSAPPARTISNAHARKPKSRDTHSAISIEDIYQSAERERINYSTACRRQNLAHAQSQTQFFRQDQSGSSRPNTSRTLSSFQRERDLNTPVNAWSEPNMSRPGSILPNAGTVLKSVANP